MHHFIFPSKDTFISDRDNLSAKNFGLTEILKVGTENQIIRFKSPTKDWVYVNALFALQPVDSFTGVFTGSFSQSGSLDDSGSFIYPAIQLSGSLSGSNMLFTASYFSGSLNGTALTSSFSGSISGSTVNGVVSGSFFSNLGTTIGQFEGTIIALRGCVTGIATGTDTRNQPNWTTTVSQFVDRALLQFDITQVSKSIVNGNIVNPVFFLNLKICDELNLPIDYIVYAYPVSESWNMGDGYLSDGGSDSGSSWIYRDNNNGTPWAVTGSSFITTSYIASQSFSYQTSDIDMDVTPIVMAWLSGSYPNYGFVLRHSDELVPTGSGFTLTFFSRDTNTIHSPYLDVRWTDSSYITGSLITGSVIITDALSGITASIESGSSFTIAGGISGSFSSSTFLILTQNFITASNQIFDFSAPNNINNSAWYANNGFHFDSWLTAWQLDPFHGGFLPHTDITFTPVPDFGSPPVLEFTGSFTGSFSGTASVNGNLSGSSSGFFVDYFSGSIDGTSSISSGSVSGSQLLLFITGSAESINQLGTFIGQLTSSLVFLNGTGSGYYLDSTFLALSGFIDGLGLSGNIIGIPIFGHVEGFTTISQSLVMGSCGATFSASLAKAIFTDGPFSGSTFTAYYTDYKFENALLTGSWLGSDLLGESVTIPLPSGIDPYAYALVTGEFINGKALGIYALSGSNSGSFYGQFVDGNLIGGILFAQLTGSFVTASYEFTSSVEISSSAFNLLDTSKPFTLTLQNVHPTYKAGDIPKIGVFARKQFPLKFFGKSTQQEQYLVPEILPTSSYYALKDNVTEEIVIDFDSYTQISCEYPSGNFFIVDTTGLPQDRYYRVLVRVEDGQTVYTFDSGKIFKLIR